MPPLVQALVARVTTRPVAVAAVSVGAVALAGSIAGSLAGVPGLAAPIIASAFIVAAHPESPAAHPRSLVAGYAICLATGLLAASLGLPPIAAIAAGCALAAIAMLALRVAHAPAIASVVVLQFAGDRIFACAAAMLLLILGLAAVQSIVRKPPVRHPIEGHVR